MYLWNIREQSLAALEGSLKREYAIVEECLTLIEKYSNRFKEYMYDDANYSEFALACHLSLNRVHHLAQGALTLILDGLMLELFSLLRTLVEGSQTVAYLSEDLKRAEKLLSDNPPTTGKIASEIKTEKAHEQELNKLAHGLKSFINDTYTHFSLRVGTRFPLELSYSQEELKRSLHALYCHLCSTIIYTQRCVVLIDPTDVYFQLELELFLAQAKGSFDDLFTAEKPL